MVNNENIKTLIINVEDEDYEAGYFIQDVMQTLRGVQEVQVEEYSNDGDTDYLDELNVIVKYDSSIWTVETLMDCVTQAEADLVSFYMELMQNDLHLPQEDAEELIKSLTEQQYAQDRAYLSYYSMSI